MRLAVSVALLGGLGSLCRWWLSAAIHRRVGLSLSREARYPGADRAAGGWGAWWFPVGMSLPVWTFVVNLLGSLAIGVVMGVFLGRPGNAPAATPRAAVALTAGFLGGFTTYSSFAFETVRLLEQRSFGAAVFNIVATVVVCLGGCALGLWLGRAVGR